MAPTLMQRKLTAILSADVVGYGGLIEADEMGTLERLKANRSLIFDPHVAAHGGRVFKLMGEGALVEFSSVVAAVNCALAIQETTAHAQQELPEAKRIRYRIGVNLGDVVIDGDDIYGEGVNVAARLQTLAPVGGVAISSVVRDQVKGKAPCVFEDMGEHTVKNIERPVHVFSVRAAVRGESEAHKVEEPRKLSICVLPFANMSGDVEQEYFSDGISEDIITDLSKVSALGVIARVTAFSFKGKNVEVPHAARHLKVSHVLEGSVRKSGGRVRITAQLIDGTSGEHVWAERYDRDLNDIFALQDEISEAIVKALKLKLLPEEKKAIEQRGTTNPDAYNLYLMARQYHVRGNDGNIRLHETIIRLCRNATTIDPSYARPWALMAIAQMNLRFVSVAAVESGLEAAERALMLDGNLAEAHAARARALTESGRYDEALGEIEIAVRLDPKSYEVNREFGRLSYRLRRFDDAIHYFEKTAALIETDFDSVGMLMSCYTAIGDLEGARRASRRTLDRAEKIIVQEPDNGSALVTAVTAVATLGDANRAKELAKRAILIDPDNISMRYNIACALIIHLREFDLALALLGPGFESFGDEMLGWAKSDPDFDPIRDDPRFRAMVASAEARLAAATQTDSRPAP